MSNLVDADLKYPISLSQSLSLSFPIPKSHLPLHLSVTSSIPAGSKIQNQAQQQVTDDVGDKSVPMAGTVSTKDTTKLEIKSEPPVPYSSASHILLLIDTTNPSVYEKALQVLFSLMRTVSFSVATGRSSSRNCVGALCYHEEGLTLLKKLEPATSKDVIAVNSFVEDPPPMPPKSSKGSGVAASASNRIGEMGPLKSAEERQEERNLALERDPVLVQPKTRAT